MTQKWRLVSDLSPHEFEELERDFNLDLEDGYVILVLTSDIAKEFASYMMSKAGIVSTKQLLDMMDE